MRNCAGRRLSFFFLPREAHFINQIFFLFFVLLFFPFFFFISISSGFSSLSLSLSLFLYFFLCLCLLNSGGTHSGQASRICRQGPSQMGRIVNTRGRSSARFARTISLCPGKKPWAGMKAKLSAPRRIPTRSGLEFGPDTRFLGFCARVYLANGGQRRITRSCEASSRKSFHKRRVIFNFPPHGIVSLRYLHLFSLSFSTSSNIRLTYMFAIA